VKGTPNVMDQYPKFRPIDLCSLSVDVQLELMKFVHPVDRFNLVLSGILKGFKNVNTGMDLCERYFEQFTFVSSGNQIVFTQS
jgi:hypothetical protein